MLRDSPHGAVVVAAAEVAYDVSAVARVCPLGQDLQDGTRVQKHSVVQVRRFRCDLQLNKHKERIT